MDTEWPWRCSGLGFGRAGSLTGTGFSGTFFHSDFNIAPPPHIHQLADINFSFPILMGPPGSQHRLFNEHLVSASSNPALALRRKKHTEKEVPADLVSTVSVRLREGYSVREVTLAKGKGH